MRTMPGPVQILKSWPERQIAQMTGLVDVVKIRDTGVGIAADLLPRVTSRTGGLGLGLPLVRSLVESQGGDVSVISGGAAKGSEFTVRLPAFVCT